MTEEKDRKIYQQVEQVISDATTEKDEQLRDEETSLKQYLGGRRLAKELLPYPGAPNLDIGGMVTFSHVESIHSRMLYALEKSEPWVSFGHRNAETALQAKTYMGRKLKEEVDIVSFADEWFQDSLIGGIRLAKACWEEEYQRVGDSWLIDIPDGLEAEAKTDEHIRVLLIARLKDLFKEFKIEEMGESKWTVKFMRDGAEQKAKVTWKVKGKRIRAEVTYIKRTFYGVRCYVVLPEDWWKTKGPLQTCRMLIHRFYLTWQQVIQRVESDKYEGIDIGEDSHDKKLSTTKIDATQDSGIEETRNEAAGLSHQQAEGDQLYEFLECYILDDFEGDGVLEDRIVTIFRPAKKVVRNVLRSSEGYQCRPFSPAIIGRIPGKHHAAIGIPKMIGDATDEETAIHNITLAAAELQAIKGFFYSDGMNMKSENMKLKPGRGIPIPSGPSGDIRSSIFIPDFTANLTPLMSIKQSIDQQTQAVDGVGDTQLQRKPQGRTLGQSAMVQNELNIRFQRIFGRCMGSVASMTGLAGLIKIIVDLYAHFGEEIEVVAKSGIKSAVSFPKAEPLSMEVTIDINKLNEQKEQQKAQAVLGVVQNPINMQVGISTPKNAYNAQKKFLETMDVADVDSYVTEPPKAKMESLDPEKENILMMYGQDVAVHPGDDDQQHMAAHDRFEIILRKNPEYAADLVLFQQHKQSHMRQFEAKMKQRAQMSQGMMTPNPMQGFMPMPVGSGEGNPGAEAMVGAGGQTDAGV